MPPFRRFLCTFCFRRTNYSITVHLGNPSVMLGAGMLARKAVEAGLSVAPYIKTSLSPGSGVVTYYLQV